MRTATSPITPCSEAAAASEADRLAAIRIRSLCHWALNRLADGDARPKHIARQLAFEAEKINRGEIEA